jgi:hypothetical protein
MVISAYLKHMKRVKCGRLKKCLVKNVWRYTKNRLSSKANMPEIMIVITETICHFVEYTESASTPECRMRCAYLLTLSSKISRQHDSKFGLRHTTSFHGTQNYWATILRTPDQTDLSLTLKFCCNKKYLILFLIKVLISLSPFQVARKR